MHSKAKLYVVATPIGNLADLSARAVETLKTVHTILAEDTRHSQRLLEHFGIHTPLQSCHEHNEREKTLEVITGLAQGQSYALISDAGTPVFSDPGAKIVNSVMVAGFEVIPIPGACAAIAALSASGYEGLPFHCYGFLPAQATQKRKILAEIGKTMAGTIAFYESPHRLVETLELMQTVWGSDKVIVLAKELTKLYETILKAPIAEILTWLAHDAKRSQGEFVLLLENTVAHQDLAQLHISLDRLLTGFMAHLTLKQAVTEVVELTGLPKNQVYEQALALKQKLI